MSIRSEATELSVALSALGGTFVDGDKESAAEYINAIFNIIKESADMANVPQEERFKAILLAFTLAGASVANTSIKFSDEP